MSLPKTKKETIMLGKARNINELRHIVNSLVTKIGTSPFILWLIGDVGAGKTTLTELVLHAFGLEKEIIVTSPTFSYLNEYRIGDKLFAHMDLYRNSHSLDPEIINHDEFHGVIVEWPKENKKLATTIIATHICEITVEKTADYARIRSYELKILLNTFK